MTDWFMVSGSNTLLRLMAFVMGCEIAHGQTSSQDLTNTGLDRQIEGPLGERLSLALAAQNLQSEHYEEFNGASQVVHSTEAKRSAYGEVTWSA